MITETILKEDVPRTARLFSFPVSGGRVLLADTLDNHFVDRQSLAFQESIKIPDVSNVFYTGTYID